MRPLTVGEVAILAQVPEGSARSALYTNEDVFESIVHSKRRVFWKLREEARHVPERG